MPQYETRPRFIKARLEAMSNKELISTLKRSREIDNYWGYSFIHKYLVKEIEKRITKCQN